MEVSKVLSLEKLCNYAFLQSDKLNELGLHEQSSSLDFAHLTSTMAFFCWQAPRRSSHSF